MAKLRAVWPALVVAGCATLPPGGFDTKAVPGLAFGQALPGSPGLSAFNGISIGRLDRPSLSSSYWNQGLMGLFLSGWGQQRSQAGGFNPFVGGLGVDPGVGRLFPSNYLTPHATPPSAKPVAQPTATSGNGLRAGEGLLRFLRPVKGPLVPPV